MAKILLGCLVGALPKKAIIACRALLDFIYLAQYTTHDTITLGYMQDALDTFHSHKTYFTEDSLLRDDLNIPKFHSLKHYIQSIKLLGTTDNYNTEAFERLHIDFAKEGWCASNTRNAFPQMIQWLSRREKMHSFENYVSWKESQELRVRGHSKSLSRNIDGKVLSLPKYPTQPRQLVSLIEQRHSAPGFTMALKNYINHLSSHPTSARNASAYNLPFQRLDIYHTFKFHPASLEEDEEVVDVIKATPPGKKRPARFDTAVVLHGDDAESTGLEGSFHFSPIISFVTQYQVPGLEEYE